MTEKPKTVLHNDCLTAPEHISLGFGASRVSLRARKPTNPTDWQPTLKPAEMEDVLVMVLMLAEGCKAVLFRLFHFFLLTSALLCFWAAADRNMACLNTF